MYLKLCIPYPAFFLFYLYIPCFVYGIEDVFHLPAASSAPVARGAPWCHLSSDGCFVFGLSFSPALPSCSKMVCTSDTLPSFGCTHNVVLRRRKEAVSYRVVLLSGGFGSLCSSEGLSLLEKGNRVEI